METAISTLELLPDTTDQIETFAHKLLQELEGGYVDASKIKSLFKNLEEVQKIIKSKLDELTLKELGENKSMEKYGMRIEKAELGTKYIYQNCNDSVYRDLKFQLEELNSEIRKRETFLKSLPLSGQELINDKTGEIERVYPPYKESTSGVKLTKL